MRTLLLRQLRRSLHLADEGELAALLAALGANAGQLPPALQPLGRGFGQLLDQVTASYEQYERDLALRTRSLELSSAELSGANDKLRLELAQREEAIRSLRQALHELLPAEAGAAADTLPASGDIAALSARLGALVRDREQGRRALANQKFALDQHAIVSITDTAGTITYANDKFCAISGYRRAELIGSNHRIVSSGRHPRAFFRDMWACIAQGRVWHGEICNRARDGGQYWVSATIVPLLDEHGLPEQYIAIRTDITDRKAAEAVVIQAKEAAEAASRAKSDFLANMSHEIRTPMNGIIGMTDLALDTELSGEQREYLGIVKSSAESLLTIINDILDFSKIEAGKLAVEAIPFDLHRLIADTLKSLALRAHEKEVELISAIAPAVPRHLVGDPGRIRQILVNLVGNAIKFTERGEVELSVELAATADGLASVHFAVRDTGIGISPEKQELIFEGFTQEDSSTTRRFGGTGLGLSISRRLVDLMDGRIWLDSMPGQGSTFHVRLPLRIDAAPLAAGDSHLDLHGKRILLVDDNATNRRVLAGMLASWEVDSQAADSGAAALALLRQPGPPFDAIILDAQMPAMDGYELARRLAAEHPQLPPLLMLSSSAMRGDARRCRDAGIAAYFSKPIAAEDLLAALSLLLSGAAPDGDQPLNRHSLHDRQPPLDILLVEDHPTNQKLALGLLGKWGHRTTLAGDGHEALAQFAAHRYDLILMDVQMPVMGGIEATRRIRAREREGGLARTPIIAMTAAAQDEDRAACLVAGMDDFVSKPIRLREVLEKLLAYGARTASAPAAAFDYAAALRRADRETVEIVTGIFLATWKRDIERLRAAVADGDGPLTERAAHGFRSSLACFAADPAVALAAQLESQARRGRLAGMAATIGALEGEISTLASHLRLVTSADSR
ncbi:MAG TPA: response regulator [Azonexus sp.]